jgi:hypothetical protein
MLRRTSKSVKEIVDKMHLPVVVRLSWTFWGDDEHIGIQVRFCFEETHIETRLLEHYHT